jgi:hypothetical protein
MAVPPPAVATNAPDPHQDRQPTSVGVLRSTGLLLGLVRALIDFGRQLASTLQQRTAASDLSGIIRDFGTSDIALIVARITRGLLRAAALETRLASRPDRPPAAPATASRRQPRVAQSAERTASAAAAAADPRLARLPTPADIAADIRRRPIGAVIADICRDLGIVPSNALWRELSIAIIANGGSLATLVKDTLHRVIMRPDDQPVAEPQAGSALFLPAAITPGTGPP